MCLLELATSLRSCPSKLKVGNGENPGPATQRQETFATVSFPIAQFDSIQKSYVALGIVPAAAVEAHDSPGAAATGSSHSHCRLHIK